MGFSTVLTQLRSAPVSRALPATWPAGLVLFFQGQARLLRLGSQSPVVILGEWKYSSGLIS